MTLGHEVWGHGARRAIVLNDWLCDTSTWEPARPYLEPSAVTWAFADLRGYGRSREIAGACTLREAVDDVLALADALGWARFAIVGHSMSTLIALHLAQHHADRVERAIVVTPAPPTGLGGDAAVLEQLRITARASDDERFARLERSWGSRLSPAWRQFKLARWRACADADAVMRYAEMFVAQGLPEPAAPIAIPLLALTGEHDAPIMRRAAVTALLSPLAPQLEVASFADCGHYPMQESPPLFATLVERFLTA